MQPSALPQSRFKRLFVLDWDLPFDQGPISSCAVPKIIYWPTISMSLHEQLHRAVHWKAEEGWLVKSA